MVPTPIDHPFRHWGSLSAVVGVIQPSQTEKKVQGVLVHHQLLLYYFILRIFGNTDVVQHVFRETVVFIAHSVGRLHYLHFTLDVSGTSGLLYID